MTSINPQPNTVYNVDSANVYRTDDLARVSEVRADEMSVKMNRDIRALLVYLLICLLTFTIGALVIEFGMIPLIAWLDGYKAYYMPTLNRIYAWCKFVPFAAIVCGFGAWLYGRSRFSRWWAVSTAKPLLVDMYNRQLHPDERQLIANEAHQMGVDQAHNPADIPTIEAY